MKTVLCIAFAAVLSVSQNPQFARPTVEAPQSDENSIAFTCPLPPKHVAFTCPLPRKNVAFTCPLPRKNVAFTCPLPRGYIA
jgi:hypothetical protein